MVNNIDMECNKILVKAFYRNAGYTLRKGNGYQNTILEPKFDELDKRVQDIYPEHYQAYKQAKEDYMNQFKMMYAEEKKTGKNENKLEEEGLAQFK